MRREMVPAVPAFLVMGYFGCSELLAEIVGYSAGFFALIGHFGVGIEAERVACHFDVLGPGNDVRFCCLG